MIGRKLLHYEILEPLGSGGMGDVFLAEDQKLKRKIALKVLPSEMAGDPERLARFQREAEVVAALNHPNIVTIHSVEEDRGVHFLTMELVDGQPLSELLSEGALSPERFRAIAVPLTDAVAAAHAKGITHRDLKPTNIMITSDGRVKVLDFGLAKFGGGSSPEGSGFDSDVATEARTREGIIVGTAPYMSPEQVAGRPADSRSDVFSLGIVLFEMATGERPFQGDTPMELFSAILKDEPIATELPESSRRILGRCLAKDPDERYQDAGELRRALADAPAKDAMPSVAVLPFTNMSADPDNEYFGDGLAEEIINALTKLEGLKVVARTSAFSFKGKDADIKEIGGKLGVETVLEGSVRKAGNRLRITAQLIDVGDGYHLWSERYDRELDDVFAIQDEITAAIVDQLEVKLLGVERETLFDHATTDQEAFALYLKGRYHFHAFSTPDLRKAVGYFQQAIDGDPSYAKAYAGLAGAIMFMGGAGPTWSLPPSETHPRAAKAVERALELDNRLPEGHAMLGVMRVAYELDWSGAERALQQSLDLAPHHADTLFWYAWFLWLRGRFDEALLQTAKALELDPLSLLFQTFTAIVLYCARRYEEAIERFEQVLAMHPNWFHAQMHLGDAYFAVGDYGRAREAYMSAREQDAEHSYYLDARLCAVHATLGRRDEALHLIGELEAASKDRYVPPTFLAAAYLGVGDHDGFFRWIDEETTCELAVAAIFPWSDPVRSDPRFQKLLDRLGDR